jgi:hypothetical protein
MISDLVFVDMKLFILRGCTLLTENCNLNIIYPLIFFKAALIPRTKDELNP